MKIDLYHLYRQFEFTNFANPIILDVLKLWAESIGCEVRMSVCKESEVNLSSDADVVGISIYTQTAPGVYRVSDKLRERGKIVILGGPHFRGPATYKEASSHCDVIVNSICPQQWKGLLNDVDKGNILPNGHRQLTVVDYEKGFRYPNHFHEAFKSKSWYQVPSVPTSIGCPYDCSFCSPYMQGDYILREIESIVNEVAQVQGKIIFLSDATFGLKKAFTKELMNALMPLRKKIGVETTLACLKDREILHAMAAGGVKWVVVGIETLASKLIKHGAVDLEEAVRKIISNAHELGMHVLGNLICGLDCDGQQSFEQIYEFYMKSYLDSIMVGILTPYPNTKLHQQFKKGGRIFDHNWEHYDCHHVVYRPRRMKVEELIEGYIELHRNISNTGFILHDALRLYRRYGIKAESIVPMVYNLFSRMSLRRKEKALRKHQEGIHIGEK